MRRTACLLVLLLSACGQAGDLYLPGEEPAQQPTSVPGTSTSSPVTPQPEPEKKKD